MSETLTLGGRTFRVDLVEEKGSCAWHWILAAPGKLVLSGAAPSSDAARRFAQEAGRALAKLGAA